MSNHAAHARPAPEPSYGKTTLWFAIPAILAALIVLPWIYHRWFLPDDSWPAYSAQVLATRVVRVDPVDSMYGNSVRYRVEVRAAWTEEGLHLESWVPTRMVNSDKAYLGLWASRQPDHCTIRVAPNNPQQRIAAFPKP